MPEFIMPLADASEARSFQSLDEFTRGYVEAMFFTSTGYGDDGDLEDASFGELASETIGRIESDCAEFQTKNAAMLQRAYDMGFAQGHYDAAMAGRDFWFSRNGHGVGFWDRDLGEVGDALHDACKCREVSLYRGDDGDLYLM